MTGEEVLQLLEEANIAGQVNESVKTMCIDNGLHYEEPTADWLAVSMIDWIRIKEAVRG